jgi:hypothetical protein
MPIDIENDLTLLMTASVDPKGMPSSATLSDPGRREADYLKTLRFYLTEHPRIRRIVFADNSGWPLENFRRLVAGEGGGKEVELLSFQLNDFPRHLGKSYGELLLMDHAVEQSQLIRNSAYFAKITGRNRLLNMTRLIELAPAPFDFYGDLRDHGIYEMLGSKSCGRHGESRFFVLTRAFYDRYFRGKYAEMDDSRGKLIEDLIYDVVKQTLGRERVIGRFRDEPAFSGLAGHWDKDYGSRKERAKRFARTAARKFTPWLWI